jgi:hypothetical protein
MILPAQACISLLHALAVTVHYIEVHLSQMMLPSLPPLRKVDKVPANHASRPLSGKKNLKGKHK